MKTHVNLLLSFLITVPSAIFAMDLPSFLSRPAPLPPISSDYQLDAIINYSVAGRPFESRLGDDEKQRAEYRNALATAVATNNRSQIIELLKKHIWGESVSAGFIWGLENNDPEIITLVLKGPEFSTVYRKTINQWINNDLVQNVSALMLASYHGHENISKKIITTDNWDQRFFQRGYPGSIDAQDSHGNTYIAYGLRGIVTPARYQELVQAGLHNDEAVLKEERAKQETRNTPIFQDIVHNLQPNGTKNPEMTRGLHTPLKRLVASYLLGDEAQNLDLTQQAIATQSSHNAQVPMDSSSSHNAITAPSNNAPFADDTQLTCAQMDIVSQNSNASHGEKRKNEEKDNRDNKKRQKRSDTRDDANGQSSSHSNMDTNK